MRHLISVLVQMEIEEAKSQEIKTLQSALTDIKLQLRETQETKSKEITDLQSALQDMQLEIEELSKGLEMSNDLAAENEQLKVSHKSSMSESFTPPYSVSVLKIVFMYIIVVVCYILFP